MTAAKKIDIPTPAKLAATCLETAEGDWRIAADMMERELERNPQTRDALIAPLIKQAVWSAIRAAARDIRSDYKAHGVTVQQDNAEGIRACARRSWYDYPIFGGKRLGDATPDEIDEAAQRYQELADANAEESERMRRVRSALKGKKTVRQQLSETKLAALME